LLPLIEDPQASWEDRYLFTHRGRWKTGANPDDHQWKGFAYPLNASPLGVQLLGRQFG